MTSPGLDVSRETMDRLSAYHDLLQKWSARINLISKSSAKDIWNRHIWDSAQIYPLCHAAHNWVDIGSGGGLPGLVVAILAKEGSPEMSVTLIESDIRKSTFLRTVIRELDLNADVIIDRVEAADPRGCDVISARALSDLGALLSFAQRHLKKHGAAVFLKGETWEKEVEIARETWSFDLVAHKSKTNPKAAVLEVREIERA